jgi:tol-pal system-associated acyl-CoA thioesterase
MQSKSTLAQDAHLWQVRVYYENTDAGGVVYHAQYLNFLERARTEWLRQVGYNHNGLSIDYQVIFVVHSMQIQFKKSAKLDDLLTISSQVANIGRASFEFLQTISLNQQTLIEAQVKLACVHAKTLKPMAIPQPILANLQKIN